MLQRYLYLLMAPTLATGLALAIAAPVRADDDDRGVACPCWTKAEARRALRAALAEVGATNFVCDSRIDVRGEESANADFVVFDGPVEERGLGRKLDLEASLSIAGREVRRASCSVEDRDGFLVREDRLTKAEAVACVRILGQVCLEAKSARRDDSDSDSGSDSDSDRSSKKKGKKKRSHHDDD